MFRIPGDLLVELNHSVPEIRYLHEPGRHRAVDQRVATPPAVRIRVVISLMPDQYWCVDRSRSGSILEILDDQRVGVENQRALVVRHGSVKPAPCVDRSNRGDAHGVGSGFVILAVRRRHVHDPGAVLGGDKIPAQHLKGILGIGEKCERR